MGAAKEIILRPIGAAEARALVRRVHYSGKAVNNSQLHIGVFYAGRLEGAMQFGPSLDKRKVQGLVRATPWNGFIELNRMAFSDRLPRNSESRALGIAMRMLRKHRPDIQWVISFADATQCGDGTIYRAAGFVLTGIKENTEIVNIPGVGIAAKITYQTTQQHIIRNGGKAAPPVGSQPLPGFQMRYLYFLDPAARARLTVPILPFSEIGRRGAGMYRGKQRAGSDTSDTPVNHTGEGGSSPTPALAR